MLLETLDCWKLLILKRTCSIARIYLVQHSGKGYRLQAALRLSTLRNSAFVRRLLLLKQPSFGKTFTKRYSVQVFSIRTAARRRITDKGVKSQRTFRIVKLGTLGPDEGLPSTASLRGQQKERQRTETKLGDTIKIEVEA